MKSKANIREQIAVDTQRFLENGGKITKLSPRARKSASAAKQSDKADFSKLPTAIKQRFNLR